MLIRVLLLVCAMVLTASPATARGAAERGVYRNVFREWRADLTDEDMDRKLDSYWQSLFEGDGQHRIYHPARPTADGPAGYILDVGNGDVRSEGMSYGMMIAVQMGRKQAFDALWNWAATHMRYREGARVGYFRWTCRPEGCEQDSVPASDGEEYIATALIMAAARWPGGSGIYDYATQAEALLETMLHLEKRNGGVVDAARSMFSQLHGQVVFVPVGDAAEFTDPSYHLPAFYELWALHARSPANRVRWRKIAAISRDFLEKAAHPATGLTPDYAEFDGRPRHVDGHGDFRFDAFRTVVNWSVDQAWWGRDRRAVRRSKRLLSFFSRQKAPYGAAFTIAGEPLDQAPSPALVASNAVATLALAPGSQPRFVADLWALEPPAGRWRYYNGLLQFMATLHLAGRFRAYGAGPLVAPAAR